MSFSLEELRKHNPIKRVSDGTVTNPLRLTCEALKYFADAQTGFLKGNASTPTPEFKDLLADLLADAMAGIDAVAATLDVDLEAALRRRLDIVEPADQTWSPVKASTFDLAVAYDDTAATMFDEWWDLKGRDAYERFAAEAGVDLHSREEILAWLDECEEAVK